MGWQQTYARHLRHQDYGEEEIGSLVEEAWKIVRALPEPYETRVRNLLDNMSRDDFDSVDFDLIASIFKTTT